MIKISLLILSGFVLHMFYLDSILIREHLIADACFVKYDNSNKKEDQEKSNKCLQQLNDMEGYKFKYFGLYKSINYKRIYPGKWRME